MSGAKKIIVFAFIILLAGVLFFLARSVTAFMSKFNLLSKIEVNRKPYTLPFSSFNAVDVRKGVSSTISLQGITVLNFWATWCKPCIEEIPGLEQLKRINDGVNIIQVSFDSLNAQVRLINNKDWTLPAYYLADTTFFKKPLLLPQTLILHDSVVVKELYGYQNWAEAQHTRFIDSLLGKQQ
jgi:thiol-disulfide isomerase/thioredoxin